MDRESQVGEVVIYRRHRLRVYQQPQFFFKWNCQVVGHNYTRGDACDARTRDGAIAKAKRIVDASWERMELSRARYLLLFDSPPPPFPSWVMPS